MATSAPDLTVMPWSIRNASSAARSIVNEIYIDDRVKDYIGRCRLGDTRSAALTI